MTGKVHENRLRRMAERQYLRLVKSRRRDSRAADFGIYMVVTDTNICVLVDATLDQVEAFLMDDSRPRYKKDKTGEFR